MHRAGGFRAKLITLFALLLIMIGVLPIIVAKTPLRNALVASVLPTDSVRVTIGDASLNWFGSPSLSAVEVKDAAGESLLAAESIRIDRTPLHLAFNSHDLGTIKIVRPVIHLKVRPDGSNLEDVLQKLIPAPAGGESKGESGSKEPVAFAFQLVEGTILADDVATGRQWRLQNVNAQYDARGNALLGSGSLVGDIAVADRGAAALPAGRFQLAIKTGENSQQQLTFQADQLALALVEPWLRRVAPDSQLSGTLSGQATATWTQTQTDALSGLSTTGSLSIDRLDATAPDLKGDHIRLARVELPWQLTAQPTGIAIESLQLRSEICQVAVRGRLDPNITAGHHDLELRGQIDGAKLAAMLPHRLNIRSDTTITSGTIDVAGAMKPTADGHSITGSLTTKQLAATKAGKPVTWDQPVNANFAIHRAGGSLALDSLQCDSKFLHVEAAGTSQQLTANANFDLNALSEQLSQFVDLSGVQLAGTGSTQVIWQQPTNDKFAAKVATDLSQLRVALGNGSIWAEPQLTLRAEAGGMINPASHQPTRVEAAQLQINGQGDQLDARLAGPVDLAGTSAPIFPITVRSTGSIARWLARAKPFFSPGDWTVDGASEFNADLRIAGNGFEAANTKLVITNLRAANADWNISESRVEFAGDARYNGATGELAANSAQLVSSTVAVATKGIHYGGSQPGAAKLSGVAAFRTDLARLASWRRSPTQPPQYHPRGEFTGNVRFAQQADRITGEITATGQNLILTTLTAATPANGKTPASPGGPQTIWQEQRVAIQGNANYDSASDRVTFDQFQIQSNTLQANASGQIQKLSSVAECDLKGTVNYDLAQVTPLLRPYLGPGVQLTGREQARFAVAGQLSAPDTLSAQTVAYTPQSAIRNPQSEISWSRRVRAQLELPWGGANLYGLPIGGGRLAASLNDGNLHFEPINLAVGEGQLTAAPNIRFDPEPAELTMPSGPVLTNVRISPEVSEAMLKYVAPVLAGATQSEGLFSLQLDGARMPISEPKRADSKGQLTVHSVRVVPGPMAAQWVSLAQQVEALAKRRDPASLIGRQVTLVSIRDQQVNFQVAGGRVYHDKMEFQVGDVVVRSQGSVGLDETIALNLEIPVQDAWVAMEPLLYGLKGQSIQIPVSGTLTKPQMDNRSIASLTGQLLQKGAGEAVGKELNRALDKFLKPKQPSQ
jgi:hypothetical protein